MHVLFILMFFILLGCSQGKDNSFSKEQEKFGPKYTDSYVDGLDVLANKKMEAFEGWVSTHEFMQSLVSLFEYAPNSDVPYKLLSKYYQNDSNTTSVNIASGTYVEAALGIYGPDIFNSINTGTANNYNYLKSAFSDWDTRVNENLNPSQIVYAIIHHLRSLPSRLQEFKVSANVISATSDKLNSYILTLTDVADMLKALNTSDDGKILVANLRVIQNTLHRMHSAELLQKQDLDLLLKQLEFPNSITNLLHTRTHTNLRYILFDVLVFKRKQYLQSLGYYHIDDLAGDEWNQFIASFPSSMQKFVTTFAMDSEEELSWYRRGIREPWWSPIKTAYLDGLNEELDKLNLDLTFDEIEKAINQEVIASLTRSLSTEAENLPAKVAKKILEGFANSESEFYFGFYSRIKDVASTAIQKDLLNNQKSFPGIEGKYVYWPVDQSKDTFKDSFWTGGKEIGSSIQANILFFENIEKTPNREIQKLFRPYAFALLNRLLAIFGFRDFNGQLYNSLHQRFNTTKGVNLDIYTYDVETGVFALPDNLILADGYKVDVTEETQLIQTVSGRASMLKAGAKMLDFFADYNTNAFDYEFSTFKFEGFSVFPKEPIFDLSLGGVSILLRNLTKGEAIFFDLKGNRLPSTGDILKDAKGAASVALLSRHGDTLLDTIQGDEIADYIIALSSLIESAKKLPNVKVGLLSKLIDGEQKDLKAMMEVIPSLRKLQYGLGLFLHNKMSVDGWLVGNYFLKDNSKSNNDFNLVRQLKYIQALLSVYKEWQSDLFLWAAVDAYYALNQKLLTVNGYSSQDTFPLYEVTETWKTLTALHAEITNTSKDKKVWWTDESEKQLKLLVEFYRNNWQDLANVD